MLAVLKIKNLALVDDLIWELGPGLISVTGQTGAGKSMIVGALKLILGERANHDLIRRGESSCTVEAIFELTDNLPHVNQLLAECGLDPCDGNSLVVKRTFGSGNSQFVNCSPCTLSVLKRLGQLLIDLHGPHDHQSLLSQERQLAMLDAYARANPEVQAYAHAFRSWERAARELEEFRGIGNASAQEVELLRYQVEEISSAGLDENEISELEKRYNQARNGARLADASTNSLSSIQKAVNSLEDARKYLRDLEKLDPDSNDFTGGFESARVEIEELEKNLQEYMERLEIDPAEMVAMENRIDLVETLKRKYGQSVAEVLAHENDARARLEKIDNREAEIARLETALCDVRREVDLAGEALTRKREEAVPRLTGEIVSHLEGLGFKQSVFEISLLPNDTPRPGGLESIDFLFGPNPGEEIKPLRIIASSGEMSRVMLAVKSALADKDDTPLMVFDEIDANVGGEIAGAVGQKMAVLGSQHQVISITHMPQVAANAALHFLVKKEVEDGSTVSRITLVNDDQRVDELARMLGGVGNETVALARKLLGVSAVTI